MKRLIKALTCTAIFTLVGISVCAELRASSSYHIGNSLTGNSIHLKGTGPGLEPLLAEVGITHDVGYHLSGGKPLNTLWNDPNNVSNFEPSFWPTALQTEWDILTLQPYANFQYNGGTLSKDRHYIGEFIDYAAGSPEIFVLQVWPRQNLWPYSDYWASGLINDPNVFTTYKRVYYDRLMEGVRADHPNESIWMIPTGEVFYELDQQIIAGTLPDVTSLDEFWFDNIHLDASVGHYVATVTLASTILKLDPHQFSPPAGWFDIGEMEFTPALLDAIHDTIYSVITTSPWSGYADFNHDGDVNAPDFLAWQRGESTFPRSNSDLAIWEQHYAALQTAEVSVVPEPSEFLLMAVGSLVLLVRPR